MWLSKLLSVAVFDHSLSFDAHLPRNPREYLHEPSIASRVESLGYIYSADSMCLSSFKCLCAVSVEETNVLGFEGPCKMSVHLSVGLQYCKLQATLIVIHCVCI